MRTIIPTNVQKIGTFFLLVQCLIPIVRGQIAPKEEAIIAYCLSSEHTGFGDRSALFSKEMKPVFDYMHTHQNPFTVIQTPADFFDHFSKNYQNFQVRNGDYGYAFHHYQKYLSILEKHLQLAREYQTVPDARKEIFIKKSATPNKRNRRKHWKKFKASQTLVSDQFEKFKSSLLLAAYTEAVMLDQRKHFALLFQKMNTLSNQNQEPLPIYVYSNHDLRVPHKVNGKVLGLSIISKYDGVFTSTTPAIKSIYPNLKGRNESLSIHLKIGADGVILSHELGHLYYLYHHWEEYLRYKEKKGPSYVEGGHGKDDPSGRSAELAERGKLFEVNK